MFGKEDTFPFVEHFAGGKPSHFWVGDYPAGGHVHWSSMLSGMKTPDFDGGHAVFSGETGGEWSRYYTAKISMEGAVTPVLSFSYFTQYPSDTPLKVMVAKNGGEFQTIHEVALGNLDDVKAWKKVQVPMDDFMDADYIQLAFDYTTFANTDNIYLDNIQLNNPVAHDLGVVLNSVPSSLKAGEMATVEALVVNGGTEAYASGASVEVVVNGTVAATQAVGALEADAQCLVAVSFAAPKIAADSTDVYLRLAYADDGNADNNTSATARVKVRHANLPAPTGVNAVRGDDGTTAISWAAPTAPTENKPVTDDFEAYADFAISNVGDWTLNDVDRGTPGGISGLDFKNNGGVEMAGLVLNTEAAGFTNTVWFPHSGKKEFAFLGNVGESSDWLVSPELPGTAQQISFYVNAPSASYDEYYQVLYSTTNEQPESFTPATGYASPVKAQRGWNEVRVNLPEGSKFFAIHYTNNDSYILLVDDITYLPDSSAVKSLSFQGYNVYRDGELVTATPTTALTLTDDAQGTQYSVTAVYAEGESKPVAIAATAATAIRGVTTAAATDDATYNLQGQRVKANRKGIYIVGGKKVVVR